MVDQVISKKAIERRYDWIEEIVKLSGHFESDSTRVEDELNEEINKNGYTALLDHLRLCSAIPESYVHDSSEEKLYSKYTDALISAVYNFLGLKSIVLTERADAADVEVVGHDFSFVADAKVFRLSRTAKNQKDFKIQAMDGWKRGKPYAMVVCPLYQLPTRSSQIYEQAAVRNVCIFSYSHLSVLVQICEKAGSEKTIKLLHDIFKTVELLNPSKDANTYWMAVNKTMLDFGQGIADIWKNEKIATYESLKVSKDIAEEHLAKERAEIMSLSHEKAIQYLIDTHKIESRLAQIRGVSDNDIMEVDTSTG